MFRIANVLLIVGAVSACASEPPRSYYIAPPPARSAPRLTPTKPITQPDKASDIRERLKGLNEQVRRARDILSERE